MALFKKDRLQEVKDQQAAKDQARKYHILVLDDEKDNVRVLSDLLADDYHVHGAEDGASALEIVKSKDVDLIISDQRMPGMTGVEFLSRTIDVQPYCIRIILTGYTDVEAIIASVNEGRVYRYLTKPWDSRELKLTIRLALDAYEAERKNRRKNEFLANTAHELRTPLNAIIGYSEMLTEQAEDLGQKDTVADLHKIHSAAKHLLALISEILDFSKIEAGKMDLFCETFGVDQLVHDVAAIIEPVTKNNGNTLVVQAGANLGTMHADVIKIRQSLYNLLSNASKFTKQGQVTLEVARESAAGGEQIVFRVRDTGVGMSPEQLTRLFQAYRQAEKSTSAKFGGTGLGLMITKRFTELMGGEIAVESSPGVGTTFTIRLPAEVRTEAPPAAASGTP